MPRKVTFSQNGKKGDNIPVKDFDYNVSLQQQGSTMQNFIIKAGAIPLGQNQPTAQSNNNNNLIDFLKGRGGDIEKEIIKKGMSKTQAQQAMNKGYMNDQQLIQARQKQKDQMKARRNKIDLQDGGFSNQHDIYGNEPDQGFENREDDFYANDDMDMDLANDPGYQRLNNGMGINDNLDEIQKQNKAIARAGAKLALGGGGGGKSSIEDMQDNRAMSEYYADLFSYAPAILNGAMKNGNPYERFKLSIKFAFSVVHSMVLQDVAQKRPVCPISGETYEGLYVMPEGHCNISMESDFIAHKLTNLLTGEQKEIKQDQDTTYIHIEGPKNAFQLYGNLTYDQTWKGNNISISLLGQLTLKFKDHEGNDQFIKLQLPDYVLANYIAADGKPRVSLINGPMVLIDEKNSFKSVIFINGLVKKKGIFQTTFEVNNPKSGVTLIDGIIYKVQSNPKSNNKKLEKVEDLQDKDFELARISGDAIDKPIIQNVPYSNWAGVHYADAIPTELAMPSDIRFREDLIMLKQGEMGGKGKVAKGKVRKNKEKKQQEANKETDKGTPGPETAS